MADETAPQGANPEEKTETPKPAPPAQAEPDWKVEARKHEDRSKEWKAKAEANQAAADRLAEIELSNKSEVEQAIARAEVAEAKAAAYEKAEQVTKWAQELTKDSPHIPASALRGSTQEELKLHFDELSALIPAPAQEQ